jgi:uncharacterized protein (DUF433 family)
LHPRLHEWAFATRTFRQMFRQEGGSTGVDGDFAARGFDNVEGETTEFARAVLTSVSAVGLTSLAEPIACRACLAYTWQRGDAGVTMFERITFDPRIMGGRACIRGMRIPVSVIVSQVANGATNKEILDNYPDLESEDIHAALRYAAWLTQEQVIAS